MTKQVANFEDLEVLHKYSVFSEHIQGIENRARLHASGIRPVTGVSQRQHASGGRPVSEVTQRARQLQRIRLMHLNSLYFATF